MLGEDLAATRLAYLVAGAADALQPPRHCARRLDLDHEIDRAHIDAEFERTRGDEAAQPTGLEFVFDEEPALARQRTVMRLDHLGRRAAVVEGETGAFGRQLVETRRQTLGEPAGVDEDDRGPVRHDEIEHARMHRRPYRSATLAARNRPTRRLVDELAQRRHVFDRHDDFDVERFAHAGVDDGDRARIVALVAGEEAGDLIERALRGGQSDALRRCDPGLLRAQRVETLERERKVGAAFGGRQRVDLVDDDVLDSAQRLTRRRRQHEVERLGRSDENVGWMTQQCTALARGRVAGAQANGRPVDRGTQTLGRQRDAGERSSQVLVDIDRQRPQWRDVEDPRAGLCGRGTGHQTVDTPQECGKRLARTCRREDECVLARRDRGPAFGLRRRGFAERGAKPLTNGRGELIEHHVAHPTHAH